MWTNDATGEEQLQKPTRVRLPDGMTRTNEDITDQDLEQTGWYWVQEDYKPVKDIITGI